jgi:DnaK suppressor protein
MKDDFSDAQLAEIRTDLEALKDSLEALLTSTEAGTKPVKLKDNQGRLSRMDELHNQSILKANRNVTANRLKQVSAALKRLESNAYGYCIECDEPISFPRLKAYPDATMCVECAE